jgi:hypothetical protein
MQLINDMHTDWDNADNDTRDSKIVFNTAGDSLWSDKATAVRITDMQVTYCSEDKDFGELCVYFNTDDWRVNKDGLIYTDSLFKQQLNEYLIAQGLATAEYSEQGMQGDNYVSCDIDGDFITAWEAKYGQLEVD